MRRFVSALFATSLLICAFLGGCKTELSGRDLVFVNSADASELVQGRSKLLGLGGKQTGVWVDARRESDFKAGHIRGAISLPYERVHDDHSILKGYEVLVVYGNDYNDSRANGMSLRLMELGYKDVRTLNGGIRAWQADGNALETDDGATADQRR